MKIKKRWLTCIIFASIGVVLSLVGAIGMKFDFSSIGRGKLQSFEGEYASETYQNQVKSLKITNYYGNISVSTKDDASNFSIQYMAYEKEGVDVNLSSDGTLNIVQGKGLSVAKPWYNAFSYLEKKGELKIEIPSSWQFESFFFNLRRGNAEITNMKINTQSYEIHQGKVQIKDLSGNDFQIKNYGGTIRMENISFEKSSRINQFFGSISIQKFFTKDLSFMIHFGDMNLSMDALKDDFRIQVKKDWLSSKNVKNNEANEQAYRISGSVKLGKVRIYFLESKA